MVTLKILRSILTERFNGVLKYGDHPEGDGCCALELLAVARGIGWTDSPSKVRSFDLRVINDIAVADDIRTAHLLPVIAAYDGSLDWPLEKQRRVAHAIVIGTIARLIAKLPLLSSDIANQCRSAATLEAAAWAAWAAKAAAEAAALASAAGVATRERVFITTCEIWLDAASD